MRLKGTTCRFGQCSILFEIHKGPVTALIKFLRVLVHSEQDIFPMYGVLNGLITGEKLEDSHF